MIDKIFGKNYYSLRFKMSGERGNFMNLHVNTRQAPEPGLYSQGVLVTEGATGVRFLFLSGQTGNIPGVGGEPVVAGGTGPQTKQALKNLLEVVKLAYGYNDENPAKFFVALDVFLKDPGTAGARTVQRNSFNIAYQEFFEANGVRRDRFPARTMIWVSEVPLEFPIEETEVEIKGIAAVPIKQQQFF